MGPQMLQNSGREVWALVRRQHFVITRGQLLWLGLHPDAIEHRIATGRLHVIHAGVYAVGRRELSRLGELMAAVLACGEGSVLSHGTAAEAWGIGPAVAARGHGPAQPSTAPTGIAVHRAALSPVHKTLRRGIPLTTPRGRWSTGLPTCKRTSWRGP